MSTREASAGPDPVAGEGTERAWRALLKSAGLARRGEVEVDSGYAMGASGPLYAVPASDPRALLVWERLGGWRRAPSAPPSVHALLDLYLPVCNASPNSPLAVGHLGQGLDGYIATSSGDSNYVTGPQNILHLHRMRALCDAVLVGAETAATDDPRLTARRAGGDNPIRVVLDPQRRLAPTLRVFSDREAPTLLVCDEARVSDETRRIGEADVVGVPAHAGRLDLGRLLEVLRDRDLVSVFIEGGGSTVSGFLEAGLLDRLQVAIAPLVTGVGRPGLRVLARKRMDECLRPSHRIFRMGEDVLFDCDLRGGKEPAEPWDAAPARRSTSGLERIL